MLEESLATLGLGGVVGELQPEIADPGYTEAVLATGNRRLVVGEAKSGLWAWVTKFFEAEPVQRLDVVTGAPPPVPKSRPAVRERKKEHKGPRYYEDYEADTAAAARAFLATKCVTRDLHYITVFTPEGNWCLDKLGLSLERRLPFQLNPGAAVCEGSTYGIPAMENLAFAAKGGADNFVMTVECGKCQERWEDGLGYQSVTVVRCPACRALNKIDTKNIHCY